MSKVHIFWEGQNILRNLYQFFVLFTASQIIGGNLQNFVAFSEYMNFKMVIFNLSMIKENQFQNDLIDYGLNRLLL